MIAGESSRLIQCSGTKVGLANCPCPECRHEWAQELDRVRARIMERCERQCLIDGDSVPGPFGIPIWIKKQWR